MARRGGKPGEWLNIDQYYGFTRYSSQLKKDFWGSYAQKPLLRNLQEISSPLDDPQPVPFFTGSAYETYPNECLGNIGLRYVGNTTVPTNFNNAAAQALGLQPAIPNMEIGCTYSVG